ncbi:MAG TPA: phage tail tape measure protein [Thermoanaerobacterales bacterium]|nr:phage tail tape measure protein [Thermoanaerobacterales bacterium]
MAAKIKGITIEIGGNTQPLNKALEDVNKKSRDLQSELRQVERLLKLDPKNTELLAQKQKLLSDAISNTKEKLDTLREAERQVQEQFKRGEIGEEQYRAIQREVIKTEEELKKLNKQLNEMGWKSVTDGLDKFGKKATDIGKSMSVKVTAPILGVGTAAAKIGMDFEQSMSKVKAMSGATAEEMELLEKAARDAGATTSKSAKEAADALGFMALAGWDVETSIAGLMPVLRLSEAGNIDLARASSLVTDSMSAMGIQVEDLGRYLDIVAQSARSSNTDIDQMAEAYIKVGGTLRGLNIPLEESSIALGMLANAGIKGAEAGTGLNAVLLNLTAPTGRAKQALEELGYTAFDSEGNFKGLATVLYDLKEMTAGMTEEQRNMYLSMIGGKEHVKTLNALMNGLDDSYAGLKESITSADGALEEIAITMQDNNKGAITELLSALEELALKIYDVISPAIGVFIEKLQGIVDWLNSLSPEMQTTIVVIAGLAAAIGPLLIVIGQMSLGISGIIGLVGKLTPILAGATGATGGLSAVIAAITGPIGIAVAAIVGITAVIVALWKTNEDFRDGLKRVWENIKQIIDGVIKVIKGIIQAFIGLITGDWTKFTEGLKNIWSGMWQAIRNIVAGAWNLLSTVFNTLKNNITNFFTGMIRSAVDWGRGLISSFIDGIKSMIGRVRDAVSSVVGTVKDYLGFSSPTKKGEGRFIEDWGYNMIEGFMEGMEKAIPDLQTSVSAITPTIKNEVITTEIDYSKIPASSRNTEVHLHVGTLIADDYGLKQLERQLRNIRISENARLGEV